MLTETVISQVKPAPVKQENMDTTVVKEQSVVPETSSDTTGGVDSQIVSTPCSHLSEYKDEKVQDYEELSRRYEVCSKAQDSVADSRKCTSVIMSRLCDPDCTDMFPIFQQLRSCVLQWNRDMEGRVDASDMSLITAILILQERALISNEKCYKDDVDKAIPGNWTPLHFASALCKFDVCDWILAQGSWSDMVTINQETPLTLALRNPDVNRYPDRLLLLIIKLITQGANVSFLDASGKTAATIARKNKCQAIANLLTAQQQRLKDFATSEMVTHLAAHPDNLCMKEYFLEPQLVTQPAGVTYTLKFKFRDPQEPVVARLTVAYYIPADASSMSDPATVPVKVNTDGPFPFKTVTLNSHKIEPEDSDYMSMSLKSELVVGNNVLEVEMIDYTDNRPMDSVIVFGCVIGKSPSL